MAGLWSHIRSLLLFFVHIYVVIHTNLPLSQARAAGTVLQHRQQQISLPDGLSIDSRFGGCGNDQLHSLQSAKLQAYNFAQAALGNIQTADLFSVFFGDEDQEIVRTVFQNVTNMLNGQGPKTVLTCHDAMNHCPEGNPGAYYWQRDDREWNAIIACPGFYTNPLAPDPCNKLSLEGRHGRGMASEAQLLVHELVHTAGIAGPSSAHIADYAYNAYGAHAMLNKTGPGSQYILPGGASHAATENADNYALFALWSWMRNQQDAKCVHNWPLWNIPASLGLFQSSSSTSASSSTQSGSLRQLLGDSDSDNLAEDDTTTDLVEGCGGGDCPSTPYDEGSGITSVGNSTDMSLAGEGSVGGSAGSTCSGSCSGTGDTSSCGVNCQCVVKGRIDPGDGSALIETYGCSGK